MKEIRATSIIRAILMSFNLLINRTAVFLCILIYVVTGNSVDATYAYTLTSFYAVLRNAVTTFFPQALTFFAETRVSVERIKNFLLYEEIEEYPGQQKGMKIPTSLYTKKEFDKQITENHHPVGIQLKNVSVKWLPTLVDANLKNITMDIAASDLVAVVGPVGGGKTTLIHAILKELPPKNGTLKVNGTISYASQEPWVFGGSVRQNIIFGQKFDKNKYEEVVRVCALERDFTLFPYGDRTLVGERGEFCTNSFYFISFYKLDISYNEKDI